MVSLRLLSPTRDTEGCGQHQKKEPCHNNQLVLEDSVSWNLEAPLSHHWDSQVAPTSATHQPRGQVQEASFTTPPTPIPCPTPRLQSSQGAPAGGILTWKASATVVRRLLPPTQRHQYSQVAHVEGTQPHPVPHQGCLSIPSMEPDNLNSYQETLGLGKSLLPLM